MILDVILGINVDTSMWIKELKLNLSDCICVLDYDYYGEPKMLNGIIYISNVDAKKHFEKFDSVCFYKSMYIFPGMYESELPSKPNGNSD